MPHTLYAHVRGWTQTLEQSATSASTVRDGRRIDLDYPVTNVTAVYDNADGTGTNYWTMGSTPSLNQRESHKEAKYIVLPTNTGLSAETDVWVTYDVPNEIRPVYGAYGSTGMVGLPEMFSVTAGPHVFSAEMSDRNTGVPEKVTIDPQMGGMVVRSVKVVTDGTNIDAYIYNDPGYSSCDTYATTNQDTDQAVGNATINAAGQSFTGDGQILRRATLYLKAVLSPTGTAVCKLYASTGSDPNRTPTGAALATSATVDVSDIGATYENVDFDFPTGTTVTNSTTFFIVLEYTGGDATNYIHWGTDTSTPGHTSNNFATYTTSWSDAATTDGCFILYTEGDPADEYIIWKSETINGIDIDDRAWVIDQSITDIYVGYVDTGANATEAETNIELRGAPLV